MDKIIKEQIKFKLNDIDRLFSEYATFRHFYRHAYSFQLNWKKMKPLVDNISSVWKETKNTMLSFLKEGEI